MDYDGQFLFTSLVAVLVTTHYYILYLSTNIVMFNVDSLVQWYVIYTEIYNYTILKQPNIERFMPITIYTYKCSLYILLECI